MNFQTGSSYLSYIAAIAQGDEFRAQAIIKELVNSGVSPKRIYTEIFIPAQQKIGEMWHNGELSIAEEHLASNISYNLLSLVRSFIRPNYKIGFSVILFALNDHPHLIGLRIVGDFLLIDGWNVEFLGGGPPLNSIIKHIHDHTPDLVGISLLTHDQFLEINKVIAEIRSLSINSKIIIGGPAISCTPEIVHNFHIMADAIGFDAPSAVEECRKLVGLDGPASQLNHYLKSIGSNIQTYRKLRRLSQLQLGTLSDLDRAYISSLENGKQNITIGALLRLANALNVSINDLVVDPINK